MPESIFDPKFDLSRSLLFSVGVNDEGLQFKNISLKFLGMVLRHLVKEAAL